jgi:hypothetical protein
MATTCSDLCRASILAECSAHTYDSCKSMGTVTDSGSPLCELEASAARPTAVATCEKKWQKEETPLRHIVTW